MNKPILLSLVVVAINGVVGMCILAGGLWYDSLKLLLLGSWILIQVVASITLIKLT